MPPFVLSGSMHPGSGPCPPNGWCPPPLDGSVIDYGIQGTWTFDRFVAEYNVPLWWAVRQYGVDHDMRFQKNLVYGVLDRYRYFEAKEATPQEKVSALREYLGLYNLPSKLVDWVEEYATSVTV